MEAAIYSNQGDEYQRLIALHWVTRLLSEDVLDWIQIEAIASPETQERILIEDIVIGYKDGHKVYIQAKKNQPKHHAWNLTDLRDILLTTKKQLQQDPTGKVILYSRTPFGDLHRLRESISMYENQSAFAANAAEEIWNIFEKFRKMIDISADEAFKNLKHIEIGYQHNFDDWERITKDDLKRHFISYERVYDFLKGLIISQSARLGASHKFMTNDLLTLLAKEGFYKTPTLTETEIIQKFKMASQIGRLSDTKIGGQKISRNDAQVVLDNITQKKKTILLTGKKGSGKTWIMLEVADQIDQSTAFELLFIKGDQFDDVYSNSEFIQRLNFDFDPTALVARLAEGRQVVVMIDSLDALSLARDQKPLKIFLSFVDKLLAVENVTVVLACRDFDLEYDPLLRNRSWENKLTVSPLDFDKDVKPILESWGMQTQELVENKKKLLSHPQNLKLIERIYDKIPINALSTEFQIVRLFFEESVEKNRKLTDGVIEALQTMSKNLFENRSLFMPKLQFNGTEEVIRILSSEGVLIIDGVRDRIAFAHQALLDYLMVRLYIKERRSTLNFVLDHPQLPFMRPAIRSFVFYSHSLDKKSFGREVMTILSDSRVAYHIKRLIVESLSELSPITDIEVNLIKGIYKNFSELFNRFLQRITSPEWFDAIHSQLTETILTKEGNDSTKYVLLYSLKKWMNVRPDKVIACWKHALSGTEPQFSPILMMLDDFSHWAAPEVLEILQILLDLEKNKSENRWIGKAISRYVDATNKGDDLLWQHITQDIPEGVITYSFFSQHGKGLNCAHYHFYKDDFLIERLRKSSWLLDKALDSIADWGSRYEFCSKNEALNCCFLKETSWEQRHHDYDHYPVDPINELCNAIQQALIFHAKEKSDYFFKTESRIRKTKDGAKAYFLIYAYLTNPDVYANRAYEFILRHDILFEDQLAHEIGELINAIIPHLLPEQQETLQKTILDRPKPNWETKDEPIWLFKWKYKQLSVIPAVFRLPDTHAFIEKWQMEFGSWPQPPEIRGWGGTIGSPISAVEMDRLSVNGLIKLFKFYGDDAARGGWSDPFDHSKGGRDEIVFVFSKCAETNPGKYQQYMDDLWESGVSKRYIFALLMGLSHHIRYRFGRLQKPNDVVFVEPLLSGDELTEKILDWIDKYPQLFESGYDTSEALYSMSYVVQREKHQKKLIDYFAKMSSHPDPVKIEQKIFSKDKTELDEDDLSHIGYNSVRGRIADAVTTLIGRIIEKGDEVPQELFGLLDRVVSDPVDAIKIHVLDLLPFLEYKMPNKGWPLFRKATEKAHPALWPHTYGFLYHQYKEHFDLVSPILSKIKKEGGKHGAEPWGLLASLCTLNDQISIDDLIFQLNEFKQEEAWGGAVKVFSSNLNSLGLRKHCLRGLIALLKDSGFPSKFLNRIEYVFEEMPMVSDETTHELLNLFIDKLPSIDDLHHLGHFFDYLAKISDSFPDWGLELVERFLKYSTKTKNAYMWQAEGLVAAIIQLLRWADSEDDQELIVRVIRIQDRLLELEWPGIDEALTRSERE